MLYIFFKRVFDLLFAVFGLVITIPFWIIAIIGIEVSDPGPVFYMAKRVGKNDRIFRMYKFRSMRIAKEANEKSFKADEDRIFAFGKFIRATKIDELPQFLNILFGDMSIVGPRPASIDQTDIVRNGEFSIVSSVKCGLTGPSALYDYIYGDTIEDEDEYEKLVLPTRLKLDVFYVHRMSFCYDLKMVYYTVVCILSSVFKRKTPKIYEELVSCVTEKEIRNSGENVETRKEESEKVLL